MTGEQRLKQIGLNPKYGKWRSPKGNYYFMVNYDSACDRFKMLQDTGRLGGVGVRWVKAQSLLRTWSQEGG